MTKKSCCTLFWSLWYEECNDANGKTIGMVKTLVPIVSNEQNSHVYLILIILTQRMQWHHWWCCWHHVTLMLVPMTSNEQKSHCTSFQLSWPKEYNAAIDNTIGMLPVLLQWCQMIKKVMLYIIFITLTLGIQWYHWQFCPHHMMPTHMQWHHMTPMPLAYCDTSANTNGNKW